MIPCNVRLVLCSFVAGCLLMGCETAPAPDSGFLDNTQQMKKSERYPFNRVWFDQQMNREQYTELLVRPVNMKYVMAQNIWEQANATTAMDINKAFKEIADYTQQTFITAAATDPKKRFKVVDVAGPKTIILELALVQLVPSKAGLNALGLVAPMGSTIVTEVAGGVLTGSEDMGKGVVAIEGRVRDGGTGKVIFMFADRRNGKFAAVDLTQYTWWGPAKDTIKDWANELIFLANNPSAQKVRENTNIHLLVW
jgi:hypothetical protein